MKPAAVVNLQKWHSRKYFIFFRNIINTAVIFCGRKTTTLAHGQTSRLFNIKFKYLLTGRPPSSDETFVFPVVDRRRHFDTIFC